MQKSPKNWILIEKFLHIFWSKFDRHLDGSHEFDTADHNPRHVWFTIIYANFHKKNIKNIFFKVNTIKPNRIRLRINEDVTSVWHNHKTSKFDDSVIVFFFFFFYVSWYQLEKNLKMSFCKFNGLEIRSRCSSDEFLWVFSRDIFSHEWKEKWIIWSGIE